LKKRPLLVSSVTSQDEEEEEKRKKKERERVRLTCQRLPSVLTEACLLSVSV
jgi:hypothetical protein